MKIVRRATFNAAHRLYRKDWGHEKNNEVFGLCNNVNFHGHNYVLEVGIDGKICFKDNVELAAGKNNHQLDISNLSKGLYFINFKINNGSSAQRKFIKQ